MISTRKTLFSFLVLVAGVGHGHEEDHTHYGVDVSFPIHYPFASEEPNQLGNRADIYRDFMEGCRKRYGKRGFACDEGERGRLAMSLRQPQSMVNYTSTGFMKIRAPEEVRRLLNTHWEKNKDWKNEEQWSAGNIYTNHWEAPTYMVSVEDTKLRGAGFNLKQKIWDAAKTTIEQWTGMELRPTSMYGIRVYTEGAILNPHVDRLPLVSSAIVNVAQDVDEPWPLEVYDREGNAVNVTMEPGDMVLYESHSLIHGRPFPLKGRYFANIFIHFEPTGRHLTESDQLFEFDDATGLPPYIIPESPEVSNWRAYNPLGWKMPFPSVTHVDTPAGHAAAAAGDVGRLAELAKSNKKALHHKDQNGWSPIHEAVRSGHVDAVAFLVESGADYNARTHGGKGGTPLNLAIANHSKNHPVTKFLMEKGALNIEPEL